MNSPSGLAAVVPRSPRHVIEDLAARGDRAVAAGQERPVVTLELASGRQLQGRCVTIADDSGLPMLLLHVGGSERVPEVMHVRVDHVVAVGYQVFRDAAADLVAPGRLEISRALVSAGDDISSKLGAKVEFGLGELLGEPQRHAVMALIPQLREALLRLAADAMGSEALRALSSVRVGAALPAGVVLVSRELQINAPLPPAAEWTVAELYIAIEKAL
jgi:hypothetical protein